MNEKLKRAPMKKRMVGLNIIVATALVIFPHQASAGAPLETIQTQVNEVLDVLRDSALKDESAKKDRIWSIIDSIFDYVELSRRTLGRNWKKLSPVQQEEFSDLFSKHLRNVYIDRILGYKDEQVVFHKERMLSEKKAEVQSKILTGSKEIPTYYRMIVKNGEWKVYDVVIEGVSLVKNYRSQFKEILKKKTPEDLLEILRKKVGKA